MLKKVITGVIACALLMGGCGSATQDGASYRQSVLKSKSRPMLQPSRSSVEAVSARSQKKERELRTLQPGDCGVDVQHVNQHLAEGHFLPPGSDSDCFDDSTYYGVIAFQKWYGLDRDGVVGPQTRLAIEKSKPPVLSGRPTTSTKVVISIRKQVLIEINKGKIKRILEISTAMPGYSTPVGTYSVYRKERMSWSIPYQVWLPYASYFNGGIATHEYPEVPVYPASHGCVRVPEPFAAQLYKFEVMGMRVDVV